MAAVQSVLVLHPPLDGQVAEAQADHGGRTFDLATNDGAYHTTGVLLKDREPKGAGIVDYLEFQRDIRLRMWSAGEDWLTFAAL